MLTQMILRSTDFVDPQILPSCMKSVWMYRWDFGVDGVQLAAAESNQDRGHLVFIITSRTSDPHSQHSRAASYFDSRPWGLYRRWYDYEDTGHSRCQSVFRAFTSNPERAAISDLQCRHYLVFSARRSDHIMPFSHELHWLKSSRENSVSFLFFCTSLHHLKSLRHFILRLTSMLVGIFVRTSVITPLMSSMRQSRWSGVPARAWNALPTHLSTYCISCYVLYRTERSRNFQRAVSRNHKYSDMTLDIIHVAVVMRDHTALTQ